MLRGQEALWSTKGLADISDKLDIIRCRVGFGGTKHNLHNRCRLQS